MAMRMKAMAMRMKSDGNEDALVEISCIEPKNILPALFLLLHLHLSSSAISISIIIINFKIIFTIYVYRSCKSGNPSKALAPVFVRQSGNWHQRLLLC